MGMLDGRPLAAGATDIGHLRDRNEDRFGVFPDLGLFVVGDGMSGMIASGEVVTELALDVMREQFEATRDAPGAHRLVEAVRLANLRIIEHASAHRSLTGACCTLAALAVDEEGVHVTHVGNNRVHRIVGDTLERLTEGHNLLNDAARLGCELPPDMSPEVARKILTRAVGMQKDLAFEVRTLPCRPGDVYLLSTDGLHDFVSPDEIVATLRASADLDEATRGLVSPAIQRDANDNITCVLVVPRSPMSTKSDAR
ncbi:protein phosphatase 2C domain-containing protein [Polyangium sp. 6x1]|uniref:PP2C family protein-serine/threonine phosphatase n=1 Tax=Polyangium sp. 6x1 TaxID=3042689 RepID=UPI0024828448|nr:protein phosphatase 2C domain-containing protein [Polyangium sp. 6x1]MDI1445975.1 protein phosphatase 2C domain-containing protein [Polyangium sp. 6x1]